MAKNEVRITFLGEDKGLASSVKGVQQDLAAMESQVKARSGGVKGAIGDVRGTFGDMADSAKSATGLATGAVAAFAIKAATDFSNTGRSIEDFSTKSGMALEESSKWVAVADDAGVSLDDLSKSFGMLGKNIGTNPDKLKELGVEIGRTATGAVDMSQTFLNVADAFNSTDDASKKAAIGQAAFGKQWQTLVRLLDEGSGQIKTSLDGVKDFQIFDQASVDRANEFYASVDKLKDAVEGLIRRVGELAAGPLGTTADQLGSLAENADTGSESVLSLGGAFKFLQKFNVINEANVAFGAFSSTVGSAKDAVAGLADSGTKGLVTAVHDVNDATDAYNRTLQTATSRVENHQAAEEAAKKVEAEHQAEIAATNKRLEEQRKALDDATDALNRKQDAALSAIDSEIGFNRAVRDVGDELGNYQNAAAAAKDATDKYGDSSDQAKQASGQLQGASDSLEDSVLKAAAAAAQYAKDQTEASGQTFTTQMSIDAQKKALEDLKAKYPDLAPAIDGFIGKLNQIPADKTVEMHVNAQNLQAIIDQYNQIKSKTVTVTVDGHVHVGGAGQASGGDVRPAASGADGGGPFWVGEQGPELFMPATAGHIFPANSKFGAASGGRGGDTYITVNMPPGSDGDDVVRALKKYERRNGRVPIKTL